VGRRDGRRVGILLGDRNGNLSLVGEREGNLEGDNDGTHVGLRTSVFVGIRDGSSKLCWRQFWGNSTGKQEEKEVGNERFSCRNS